MRKNDRIAAGVALSTSLLLATSALAGGFAIREQSTTGLGSAFAGSAAGADLSSMYWNPAAVTTQDGLNSASAYTLIIPDTHIDAAGAGIDADIGTLGILGSSYYNYQLNKDLYVGLSVTAPFGLTTEADPKVWAGAVLGRKSEMLTVNASPTVGYKVAPGVSVAGGLQIEYIKARLESGATPAPAAPSAVVKGDDWGVGFTAGVLLEPAEGTKIGLGYRSTINHKLKGTQHVGGLLGPLDISAKFDTPQMITASLRQELSAGLALMANYEWTGWSSLKEFRVVGGTNPPPDDYSWNDSWLASVGAEMALMPNLTGRTGIGYEKSPVPDATRSARLPDSDRVWLSAGATYNWSASTQIDVGYSHIFFDDATVARAPIAGASVSNSADIISAGLRVKW